MKVTESIILPADPDAIAAMYSDPEYARLRTAELEGAETTTVVDGDPAGAFTVSSRHSVPSSVAPEMVRGLLGSRVEVREVQTWEAPDASGARHGSLRVELSGVPVTLSGTYRLAAAGVGSSELVSDAETSVRVPLLGKRLEKMAGEYIPKYLEHERTTATSYLATRA